MTRPARSIWLTAAICVSLGALPARAAVPPPASWQPPTDAEPVRSDAAEAFEAGEAAFDAEDYETAVEHFTRAQSLLPHPHTAHNLGLAQARAGQPLQAWATFTTLRDESTDPQQRADAELQLARLAPEVARLRIDAPSGQVVTIDGATVPPGEVVVRRPGPVTVSVGSQRVEVELRGGELRAVELRDVQAPSGKPPRSPAQTGLLATSLVLAAATTGTAAAAAFGPDDRRRALTFSAVGLGGTTVVFAATALALHLRSARRR